MISKTRFDADEDPAVDLDDGWEAVEEEVAAVEAFERALVEEGILPDRRALFLSRHRGVLQALGALILALNVAVISILMVFFIFNLGLHAGH